MKKQYILVSLVAVILFLGGVWWRQSTRLNVGVWQTHVKARCGMVEDVQKHHIRSGMHRTKVLSVLGPPDWEEVSSAESSGYLRYDLGTCWDLFPLDEYFLFVYYDSEALITETYVGE